MAVLLAVALGLVVRALYLLASRHVPLGVLLGWRLPVLGIALCVALALVVRLAQREWAASRARAADHARIAIGAALRLALVVSVLGWLAFLWLAQPFQRLWFDLALGLVAGAWALALLVRRAAMGRQPRLVRGVELVLFSACLAAPLLESALRGWASRWPTPLNARVGAGPAELIRRFRCPPGLVRFGFACNSRGDYDVEFQPPSAQDERPLIVAIGDSFNVGMVPHSWHYTTICEELLGARIHNIGVPGIGPPEYLSLLVDEALPLRPDLVLIGVFVGNDLNVADVLAGLPDAGLRAWLQRDQVLSFVLPRRLARLRAARAPHESSGGGPGMPATAPRPMDREAAALAFPWVRDPALEEPTYPAEAFLHIETTRALDLCAGVPPSFELFCRSLLDARRAAGDTPLRVLLIPDEFQVEDGLWERVRAHAGRELDRDAPQRLVGAWLAEQGIACLDLLPVLRAVPPGPDGRRHLYHELDTHFNARGNEVTARALAEFLR